MRQLLAICAVGSIVAACDFVSSRSQDRRPDAWDRTRQCADQGDAFARELRGDAGNAPIQVSDWTTHYNSRHNRCYVLVGYWNSSAKPGGTGSELPMSFQRVYDAFERRSVARATSQRLDETGESIWCGMTDEVTGETTSPACEDVNKYVQTLMRE